MSDPYHGYFIDNRFRHSQPGHSFHSVNPANPSENVLAVREYPDLIDAAFAAAARAFDGWRDLPVKRRESHLKNLRAVFRRRRVELADAIHREMGKSEAEAEQELDAVLAKFDITFEAARRDRSGAIRVRVAERVDGRVSCEPIGVMYIPGPFNFPLHIPNGHWAPALLAGNTIVFKPSEITPLTGQLAADCAREADLPPGVFNMIHGGAAISKAALRRRELGGVLFTGSFAAGVSIRKSLAARPEVMVALEMGGNNPAIVWSDADLDLAAAEIYKGATQTSGQRCTATRRSIAHRRIFAALAKRLARLFESQPLPPLASHRAWLAYRRLTGKIRRAGLNILAIGPAAGGGFDAPALLAEIMPRQRVASFIREEWFCPVMFIESADSFDQAVARANDNDYGLAASVFTRSRKTYEQFRRRVRAGLINWNRSTSGASSLLPFGGIGHSGNFRPAGAASIHYCRYPLSSLEARP